MELSVPSPPTFSLPAALLPITALDLEVQGQNQIRHLGAVRDDSQSWERKDVKLPDLRHLDDFCVNSRFILGHNLIHHDLPILRAVNPDLTLLRKPVIDTLFLSPLAFPRNPYHHLVKGYKLVRDSLNDPVQDARLALTAFQEQYGALRTQAQKKPDLVRFFHYCFATHGKGTATHHYRGLALVCGTLVDPTFQSDAQALEALVRTNRDKACPRQLRRVAHTHFAAVGTRSPLAYCAAWLQVAGGNSILPPWVRHQFPALTDMLKQLRETHCGQADCTYCTNNHDPLLHLKRFFQYPDFRVTEDGQPLQQKLVLGGMQGRSLLGILPTSGGKSVCFQVPALARYYRRGLLTVVISPLQALMKDQVDSLEAKTGSTAVAAVHGLLTPPERGAVLERVRLGDIGLLYLSPEQLRNKSVTRMLAQREIGCWVFDEAHCLSKWGHDFRPDYLYCARFIRQQAQRNQEAPPPIACFTATAKEDVIEDIRQHFRENLECKLELHQAGVERGNLHFEVHLVTQAAKNGRVADLVREHLSDDGSCIVYCATRKAAEELAAFLVHAGTPAQHFHGGLDAPDKKEIMDRFMHNAVRVVCATNAFGMGVDKENVRLVLHANVPGSLENYLQEAGRAGRDGALATCLLLFDEQDIETQFRLGALSEVNQRDIQQVLRGIRRKEKQPEKDVVITSGELIRSEAVDTSFDLNDSFADTKVKTAVAWLERSGFLERNQNSNQVFHGKPLFATLEAAQAQLDRLQLSPPHRCKWERLLSVLLNADPDEGLNADYLAEELGRMYPDGDKGALQTHEVMHILNQMAQAGLVSEGLRMTAFLRPKGRNHARGVFAQLCQLEQRMLEALYEEFPDVETETDYPLNLRLLNQQMLDRGLEYSNPETLRNMLRSLATDGKGLAGDTGSIEFRYVFKDHYRVRLRRSWKVLWKTAKRRRALSDSILEALYRNIAPEAQSSQAEVLVEFSLQNLQETLRDLQEDKQMAALERGLLYLHEQNVIILQQGLAVFRQAMTLKLNPEARARRYNRGDYAPLARHYQARVTQVHVMNEYVQLGLQDMMAALALVRDYFTQSNVAFLNRYFRGRRELLELATSQQSLQQIVDALGNSQQQAIVQAPPDSNMLVLAGPGAGKTRVVVHRCAYLTRVQRVRPFSILVLCYNHSSAVVLRRRLKGLLGSEARTVMVYTFHGLALRLLGQGFDPGRKKDRETATLDFERLISDATALLQGNTDVPGLPPDQQRERLLSGIQHILVDEYQDINARQYDMISALAGRTLSAEEEKLSILVVGDDDQSIYEFRQANVKYIRQFEQEYDAQRFYLVQNYRSTRHIITVANRLIAHNRDRMKTTQNIRINEARQVMLRGGYLEQEDPVSQGRVQVLSCQDVTAQTAAAVQELQRLRGLWPDLEWSDMAVLARNGMTHPELTHFRSAAEHADIPVNLPLTEDQTVSLFRIREFHTLLDRIRKEEDALVTPAVLRQWTDAGGSNTSPWNATLHSVVESWEIETGGSELPARAFAAFLVDYLREAYREQRRGTGVHVSTVHACKGLEFRVVVILDGNWQIRNEQKREEERRLFYVGMTRAQECLILMQRQDVRNPHIPQLEGEGCLKRSVAPDGSYPLKGYRTLGMKDVYLGYAGGFPPAHKVHKAISDLNAGDAVELSPSAGQVHSQGQTIARLSRAAQAQDWSQCQGGTVEGRILALVHRKTEDEGAAFQHRNRCREWEIPLVELTWKAYGPD